MRSYLLLVIFLFLAWPTCFVLAADQLLIPLQASRISLNPSGIQDQSSLWVSRQVTCQLARFEKGDVQLDAAERMYFRSATELEVSLRPNIKFVDGSPLRTRDVLASLRYLSENRRVLRNIFSWVKSYREINDLKFVIKLKNPVPQFLKVLSSPNYGIFSEKFIRDVRKNPELWASPISCGGYRVEGFHSKDSSIHLKPRNQGLDIEFDFLGQGQLSVEQAKAYDIIGLQILEGKDPAGFRKEKLFDPYQLFLGLNSKLPAWNTRGKRCQLFSQLRTEGVVNAYKGLAEKATDFVPRGVLGFDPNVRYQDEVHKLWDPRIALKNEIKVSFLSVSIPPFARGAYIEMLEKIFPKVDVSEIRNPKKFGIQFVDSKRDAILFGLKSNYLDAYEYILIFSEKEANVSNIFDKNLISLIATTQQLDSASERSAVYKKVNKVIRDECYIYPIATIPMKIIFVKENRETPNLGKVPLNEYYLGDVK